MKQCPICQSTYESGMTCPSCNVPLINLGGPDENQKSSGRRRAEAPQQRAPQQDNNDPYGFDIGGDSSSSRREPRREREPRPRREAPQRQRSSRNDHYGQPVLDPRVLIGIIAAAVVVVVVIVILVVAKPGLSKDPCRKGHDMVPATCTEASYCSVCGETEGEPLGHEMVDATETEPAYCAVCGETFGDPLGVAGEFEGTGTVVDEAPADITFTTTNYQLAETYNCYQVWPSNGYSTSVKEQKSDPDPHTADMAFDNRDETSWQEGSAGDGIGDVVGFNLDTTYQVRAISLKLGNWRSDKHWAQNGRPSSLLVKIGDYSEYCYFDDVQEVYWVTLNQAVPASNIELTIDGAWSGNQDWDDTCIAEVNVWCE